MFGKKQENKRPDVQLFTILDTKVGIYDNPIQAPTAEDLMRDIVNSFLDHRAASNRFIRNAEDFQLFKIGAYQREEGILTSHPPEHVCNLTDLRIQARALSARLNAQDQKPPLGIVPT